MEEKKIVETLFVRRSVNVSEQDIDDILCTAFEGGITYWCDSVRVVGNYLGKYASDQISRGGKLKFHVEEPFDNEETEHKLRKVPCKPGRTWRVSRRIRKDQNRIRTGNMDPRSYIGRRSRSVRKRMGNGKRPENKRWTAGDGKE